MYFVENYFTCTKILTGITLRITTRQTASINLYHETEISLIISLLPVREVFIHSCIHNSFVQFLFAHFLTWTWFLRQRWFKIYSSCKKTNKQTNKHYLRQKIIYKIHITAAFSTWCKHYNFPNMRYICKTSTLKNNKVCTLYQTIGEIVILCPFSLNKNPKMLPCLSLTTVKITWSDVSHECLVTWPPTYIKTSQYTQ